MKPFLRMRKVLLYVLFLSFGSAKEPYAYLYLLPFDNIQNDPAVEWIAAGLSDMFREEMKNVYGVRIKTKDELETIQAFFSVHESDFVSEISNFFLQIVEKACR